VGHVGRMRDIWSEYDILVGKRGSKRLLRRFMRGWRIIRVLKWILEKYGRKAWTELI